MNVVFVHDHKFRRVAGKLYSPGGLSNEILERYVSVFGSITVIGRIIEENTAASTYSLISNPNISILPSADLKEKCRQADAVIARLPSINGYKAVHYAKKFHKPYLVEVVGCTWDAYVNYGMKGKAAALPAYLLMRKCVKNAPYAVYVTKFFLQKRYPCKGTTAAISDVSLSDGVQTPKHEPYLPGGPLVLGTVAAVDVAYKGQSYIVRAIPMIKDRLGVDVIYKLVGAGNTENLRRVAQEAGVSSLVFEGTLPHDDVFAWLDTLDLYVQPSLVEGLSRAVIEAMSRGLPCILSNCGGNGELVDPEYLVTLKDKNRLAQLFADRICALVEQKQLQQVGEKNQQVALSQYGTAHLAQIRNDFYNLFKSFVNQ